MNEEDCRALREDVNRLTRNLHGENGAYRGLISRMDIVESDLKDLKAMGEEAKEEREKRTTNEQSRRKWVAALALTVAGGALMSLFNLVINLLQTYAVAP